MASCDLTTRQKLAEAESEYHALMTGLKPRVLVDRNGERVEYTAANAAKLLRYIESLRAMVGTSDRIGPARVFF